MGVFLELCGAVHLERVEQLGEGRNVLFQGVAHEDVTGNGEHLGFHAGVLPGDGEVTLFKDAVEVLVQAGDQHVVDGGEVVEDGAAGDASALGECFGIQRAVAAFKDERFCSFNDCDAVLGFAGGALICNVCRGFNEFCHSFTIRVICTASK